ncbi:TBC domain-containing protein [Rhizoctonia solani AG-1 IA]|uniref:TBC domain-containing protein n=1 Tax=Thanatephorus cucumeris (strain AG1-IA) TaxID=983506 RepID=L8X9D1_THACA|nr:TBC domain-containing protein [Rhizoctonia solani AG-1 IA]
MESADLARWQRFASKGGIGKSTALVDRIAERDGDLMFLKGFCEGVVGRFAITDVQVHGKLKRAVMARRPASGNPASPNPSPIALAATPSPAVPHTTTLLPLRASVNETSVSGPHSSDNGTGVSAWLASQPSPPSHENIPITETEPEPPVSRRTESISLPHPSSPLDPQDSPLREKDPASSLRPSKSQRTSPSSSPSSSTRNRPPLHVDTSPPVSVPQRESQSLASLVSTEASPLSDESVYSLHRGQSGTEIHREPEHGEKVPQFQSQANMRRSEAGSIQGFASSYQPNPNDAETESRADMESSISRTSTPSIGDPFQHDQPSTSSQLSSPTQLRALPRTTNDSARPVQVVRTPREGGIGSREEPEGSLYSADRESRYSNQALDATASGNGRVVSTSLSDAGAGIGLSLMGGLLGSRGDSDSESDYGQPSEDEADVPSQSHRESPGREQSQRVSNQSHTHGGDEGLYRTNSMIHQPRSGDVTPLGTGSMTPLNGGLSTSQSPSLTNSRSSTPPFGFELDPTTSLSQDTRFGGKATGDTLTSDLKAPTEETKLALTSDASSSPANSSKDAHSETGPIHPTEEGSSDNESDYGEEVGQSGSGSQVPPPGSDAFPRYSNESMQQHDDDNDFDLPPVRPPYHRASTSIRSITSSDAGGYYDDAIYDHYRYSQISMAARSVRMSVFGAEEIPPLPNSGELEREPGVAERRDKQFAPLNLSPKSGPQGSLSSPGSQIQFSPGLNGPKSPSVRSPLGQGEPASPRLMATNTSPLAAGPIFQTQMATRDNSGEIRDESEDRQVDKNGTSLSLKTTELPVTASSATIGALVTSPGGLGLPLSPGASGPPSPLSPNLASTLRQVIEQHRAPEPGLQAPLQAEIVDQEPMLGSPAAVNSPQQGYSAYEPSPIASLQRRPSRFAPHPNAPKPAHMFAPNASTGTHLTSPAQGESDNHPSTGPQHMRLHDALTLVVQRLRNNGMAGGTPTIHGRTHSELSLSWTPVPISFVFDPDGRSIPMFNRPALVPQRTIGVAQRSASMNAHPSTTTGAPVNGGEYVGSKLRPRSRSFSDVPSEQLATYRVSGDAPRTPMEPNRPRRASGATPATRSPLIQPPTPGPVQGQSTPIKPLKGADTPLRSPVSPPTSPLKQVPPPLPNAPSSGSSKSPFRGLRQVASNTMMRVGLQGSISSMPTRQSSDNLHHSPVDSQRKPSEDMPRQNSSVTNISSPTSPSTSPMASSHVSLNSKISSTGLRLAGANRPATDTPTTPLSPIASVEPTEETVHYNDMDFDMVKPMRSRVSTVRTSEDGRQSISRSSQHSDHPRGHQDDGHEHSPTSPIVSLPPNQTHVPSTPVLTAKAGSHNSLTTSDSIAAHISREQRWISTMQVVPSPSVRRNKKIKKLLLEGVPARRMVGVYSQLAKRGKVPATPEIIKDAELCFVAQPHLQSPSGPVVTILQAYLTMVPDDAFWTFVALMDKYLRGYCAVNSLQMEADSVFFAKTLESNDPQLATNSEIWVCLLVTSVNHVGLVLLGYLKKEILALTPKSSPGALDCLLSISSQTLPADPDQLIASAYAVRFKDDDMRKMRPKIESQLRKEPGFTRPVLTRDALRK